MGITKYVIKPFLWAGMLLATAPGFASVNAKTTTLLTPHQAYYNLYWHGVKVGHSVYTLEKKPATKNHFLVQWASQPILSFLPFKSFETSAFLFKENALHPQRYTYQIRNKKKALSGEIKFQGQKALKHSVQDKITVYFQLRHDLSAQKDTLQYTVVEPERTKHYHFKIRGTETLKTALGTYSATVIDHVSDNCERLTRLWLADDLDFLIVKLQQFKKGKLIAESKIKRLTIKDQITP